MKIVAKPENVIDGIANGRLDRYRNLDLLLPSDLCGKAKEHCQTQHDKLVKQAERLFKDGKNDLANEKLRKAKVYEETKARIKDSGITMKEARFARLHPKLFTAGRIMKISHRAGLKTSGNAALIGGVVSLVSNIKAMAVDGDKTLPEAAASLLADTGKAAAEGYATGFIGTGASALLRQAESSGLQYLGKSSLPTMMATMALDSALLLKKYLSGDIDGVDFLEKMGEKGTSFWAGAAMATVGQAVIPIPVVGAVLGGMVGAAMSSVMYDVCLSTFKEARESERSYRETKKMCEESRELLATWREESARRFRLYFQDLKTGLQGCLNDMSSLLASDDLDSEGMDCLAMCVDRLSEMLGKPTHFWTFEEFESVLDSGGTIVI
jgi:hypothetical protein